MFNSSILVMSLSGPTALRGIRAAASIGVAGESLLSPTESERGRGRQSPSRDRTPARSLFSQTQPLEPAHGERVSIGAPAAMHPQTK